MQSCSSAELIAMKTGGRREKGVFLAFEIETIAAGGIGGLEALRNLSE